MPGVHTIDLLIGLPEITDAVVIDAATQPGYAGTPLVELNGAAAGSSSGFWIAVGGCTVRGFVINRFDHSGILVRSANNVIQGNYIGTDPTGTLPRSNSAGIVVSNSSDNMIGGATAAARNVISGNSSDGISVLGSGNQIKGNFIGTNATGTAALGNGSDGIEIFNAGDTTSTANVIGGISTGGNLISGNQRGISISAAGQFVQGKPYWHGCLGHNGSWQQHRHRLQG